jgi:hypothetical protein
MRYVRAAGAVLLLAVWSGAAAGQILSQPSPPPTVVANAEQWYQFREPIVHGGNVYYPAGPTVYFNGNTMVRVGTYRGVPLYADTTVEPFSVVLVPLEGRLLQRYERRRTGDLAGTTGSSAPAFPVDRAPAPTGEPSGVSLLSSVPQIPGPPTFQAPIARAIPQVPDETAALSPLLRTFPQAPPPALPPASAPPIPVQPPVIVMPETVGTAGARPTVQEIWIEYEGRRYESAGRAVPLDNTRHFLAGEYRGFPVYRDRQDPSGRLILLPTRSDLLAPYRRVD